MLRNPKFGWVTLDMKDKENRVFFDISYLSDPVFSLLKIFIEMYKNNSNYIEQGICICFEGEGPDIYLSFFDLYTVVVITTDKYETSIIFKGFEKLSKELIYDLEHNDFLEKYCSSWYDEDIYKSSKKTLIKDIRKLKKLMYKKHKKRYF